MKERQKGQKLRGKRRVREHFGRCSRKKKMKKVLAWHPNIRSLTTLIAFFLIFSTTSKRMEFDALISSTMSAALTSPFPSSHANCCHSLDCSSSSWTSWTSSSPRLNCLKYRKMRLSFCRKRSMPKCTSRDAILRGSHDTTDKEKVGEFRNFLSRELSLVGKEPDDHTLLRFLRMRGFDKEKAKEMLLNYLKWREEFQVDKVCKEFKFDEKEKVKKCYPHGFHGVDKYGRPVYIERIGMADIHKLLKVTTVERFVKYHVTEQEKTLSLRFPACSVSAKKHIASTTSIFDVKDVGVSNFSKNARSLFWKIQKIDSSYYPETLHRLFIVNAGPGFTLLWRLIKPFIEQRTQVKIQVLEDIKNLAEVIDPSNLPTFLDGHCTCSEYDGCLFSDKGPWNDPKIIDALQEMRDAEEQCETHMSTRHVFGCDENVHIKDVYDVTPERAPSSGKPEEAQVSHLPLVMQKIHKIEAVICDANAKIQTLEAALMDAKLVLQGLVEHMENLRDMIIVTNNTA